MPIGSILVVDDIEENRDLLSRRLRRRGYNTMVAEDGPSALTTIEAHSFDLVLLDIRMPGMSGIEVLEEIRKTHPKTALPVLMVTAETDSAEVVKALGLGANDYITKPLDYPVALARIEAQLSMRQEVEQSKREAAVLSSTDFERGFVLDDRYRIDSSLGEGGFAVVYRATQLSSGQSVALKILRADRIIEQKDGSVEVARFEQEMRLIGKIRHPNIVKLIDSGRLRVEHKVRAPMVNKVIATGETSVHKRRKPSDTEPLPVGETDIPYLVMEYLQGETLHEFLEREGVLAIDQAVDLLLPILSALHVAHVEGVIHRDLKPHNLFLSPAPNGLHPRVLDFGVAKLVGDGVSDLTVTASILGTPDYMPPEQARGLSNISPAADQYSIGAVLYQCLTGRQPYVAESFIKLLHMVAGGELDSPRSLNQTIPATLDDIILRAMASDPGDRFSDVLAFGRALLPYASDVSQTTWGDNFG